MATAKKLPQFLKPFFWESYFDKLTLKNDSPYIAARIMDRGSEKTWEWMFENIPLDIIKNTLKNYRDFSLLSANYWSIVLNIPREQIKCFQEPWITMRKRHWPR